MEHRPKADNTQASILGGRPEANDTEATHWEQKLEHAEESGMSTGDW